jgi:hypothetical protein
VISCWGGGHARGAVTELGSRFPGVMVQPKGLIATEAFMSLPFGKDQYNNWLHPLAINSHFFEFMDDNGYVKFVDELRKGEEYQIIVTTMGGFYRYAMKDRIRVNGYVETTPSIEFIGKLDSVSDYYGEKLNDQFVAYLIDILVTELPGGVSFSMLAPDGEQKPERYTLYMQVETQVNGELCDRLEQELCKNPRYAECRRLGQLNKAGIFLIEQAANKTYLLASMTAGKRLGDIKPVKLSKKADWSSVFSGAYLT